MKSIYQTTAIIGFIAAITTAIPTEAAQYIIAQTISVQDQGLFNRGLEKIKQQDYDGAIADFTTLIEGNTSGNPINPRYYTNRAVANYRKGNYQAAIEDFNQALSIDKESIFAYINRGIVYEKIGEYQNAEESWQEAINRLKLRVEIQNDSIVEESKEDLVLAYTYLGNLYQFQNRHDDAITQYTEVINLEPDNAEAYLRRGYSYFSLNNYDLAVPDYQKVTEFDQQSAEAHNNLGAVYLANGESEKAIEEFNQAVRIDNNNGDFFFNLGLAHLENNQPDSNFNACINFDVAKKLYEANQQADGARLVDVKINEINCEEERN